MRPPIVGSCQRDVTIFDSIDKAKQHIEIIDVLEGSWKLWDSEGHVLDIQATSGLDLGRFEIREPDRPVVDLASLRKALLYSLVYFGYERHKLEQCSIAMLCEMLRAREERSERAIPPIVAVKDGEVAIFRKVRELEEGGKIDQTSIKEWRFFDSEGRALQVVPARSWFRWKKGLQIKYAELHPMHSDEMRRALYGWLIGQGVSSDQLENCSPTELIYLCR